MAVTYAKEKLFRIKALILVHNSEFRTLPDAVILPYFKGAGGVLKIGGSIMDIETLRLFERIVIALGGILSIWLGYKLFSIAEIKTESSGSFKSAVATMTMTKIGPGVFFALFGAFILYTGITTTISIGTHARQANQANAISILSDTNSAIAQLRTEIDKLPDGEIKSKLITLLTGLQNNSIQFIGEVFRSYETG